MRYRSMLLLTVFSLALSAGWFSWREARGSSHEIERKERDEDRARHALEKGEILPLDRVIARLHDAVPGEISRVELENEHGIWVYEFKVISPVGRMVEVRMNAKTGEMIGKPEE